MLIWEQSESSFEMPVTPQYENFADAFMSDDDEILIQAYGSTGARFPSAGAEQNLPVNGIFF